MKKLKSLSIFFPALNDAKTLPNLVQKAYKTGNSLAYDFEIIIVNDFSTDNTLDVLESLNEKYPDLKIINHKKNLGYGAALSSGFKHAKNEWVFYTDGDGQYDPEELSLLVRFCDIADAINGFKKDRQDNILRKTIGLLYNFFLQKIYSLPVSDVDCDFRLIKKSFLKKINLSFKSGAVCLELIVKLKKSRAKFAETGVTHRKRIYGKSQFFTFKNIFNTLKDNFIFFIHYLMTNNQKRIAKIIL